MDNRLLCQPARYLPALVDAPALSDRDTSTKTMYSVGQLISFQ